MNHQDAKSAKIALPLHVVQIGRVPYAEAVELQLRLVEARRAGRVPDLLLLLEHPPVITCGRGTRPGHVLADRATLARREVELHESSRGGDVTFHGPGQLVGYPIVDLRAREGDVHRYLRQLEEGLIRGLADFEITAGRIEGLTGVWVGDEKIAAIGVGVRHWVTYHGFALNVDLDLAYFDLIVPCGLAGRGVTSIAALRSAAPPLDEVARVMAGRVAAALGSELDSGREPVRGLGIIERFASLPDG